MCVISKISDFRLLSRAELLTFGKSVLPVNECMCKCVYMFLCVQVCIYIQVCSCASAHVVNMSTIYICVYVYMTYISHMSHIHTHTHIYDPLLIQSPLRASSRGLLPPFQHYYQDSKYVPQHPAFLHMFWTSYSSLHALMAISLSTRLPPWSQITTSFHLFHYL